MAELSFAGTSRPSRARGLKQDAHGSLQYEAAVAPFTGAWIETPLRQSRLARAWVAPITGAWIETSAPKACSYIPLVAPFTGAWIETPDMRPTGC